MGLATEVIQNCKICQEDFERPRRLLDSLGTDKFDELVCPTCVKGLEKEKEEYIEVKEIPKIIKQPKIKSRAAAGGGLVGKAFRGKTK